MFKHKLCGLLAMAALAAVGNAATADAAPLIEADSYPVTISAPPLQHSVFSIGGIYQWECKAPTLLGGTLAAASSSLSLTPSFAECSWHWPITDPASVVQMNMNGCTFHLSSIAFVKKGEYNTLFALECPAGKQVVIEMHSGLPVICTMTVPAQSGKSLARLIDLANKEGSADDEIRNEFEVGKLKYSLTSFGCPVKTGTYEDMTYLGDHALKATKSGTQVGLRVSGE